MTSWIAFFLVAFVLLGSALAVVRSRDLVRAVLWLAVTLLSTAATYVALRADFLAAVQVLLYTGGVITLMLFAVMLTRRVAGAGIALEPRSLLAGAPALLVLGVVGHAIYRGVEPGQPAAGLEPDSVGLGRLFLTEYVLPFEVLSLVLIASMVGAITLAGKDPPERGATPPWQRKPNATRSP